MTLIPRSGRSRGWRFLIAGAAFVSGQGGHAEAAEITAYGGGKLQYDSNLFRTADDGAASLTGPSSDWSYNATAGATLSTQNDSLDATLSAAASRNWFDRNRYLDFTGYTLKGQLKKDWETIHLSLDGQQDHRLSSFSDIRTSARNIQTLTLLKGEAGTAIAGDWRILLGGSLVRSANSAAAVQSSDYRRLGAKFGLGYYSPAGNAIALQFTHADGHGLNQSQVDIGGTAVPYRLDYTENGVELSLLYAPSVASALQLQLGYVDRQDHSVFDNDYSGLIGQATFSWSPRDTIRLALNAGRRLESESYIYSDSVRVNYLNVSAEGDLSPTLTLKTGFQLTRQHYSYDVQAPVALAARTENLKILTGAMNYAPTERYTISLEASHEMRSANQPGFHYAANVVRLTGKVNFGDKSTPAPQSGGQ